MSKIHFVKHHHELVTEPIAEALRRGMVALKVVVTEEKMGEEKAVKPKQTGMALEMDVIKKITHQLERLPYGQGAEQSILRFVQEWASRRPMPGAGSPQANGQLPLAAKDDGFPE